MEVKINREIGDYTESVYFGLSLRQFIFSILACGVAVGLYFLLKPLFGIETLSWVCILGAAPFAAIGFFSWHGMTAEKAFFAYLRSEILMPNELKFKSINLYDEIERSDKDVRLTRKAEKPRRNKRKFR
ncbi:MAG: PrgI family protein [Ruminococcaceae bacterium]|nr:PrgI family protein [Oscillospiraceae bacterium]